MAESERKAWLRWRRQGIGGSDAAAIVGLDPFKSAMSVWLSKVTDVGDDSEEDRSGPMHWGKRLEPVIIEEFKDQTGLIVTDQQARMEHPTLPYMRATIDGLVRNPDDPFEHKDGSSMALGLYEAKTASRGANRWQDADGNFIVPEHVQVQVQHNLAVTGYDVAWVAALLLSPVPDLKIFPVERDEAAITMLYEYEAEFWRMVQERRPPSVDGSDETSQALRRAYAKPTKTAVALDEDQAALLVMWSTSKQLEVEAHASLQSAENAIMAIMGDAEEATVNGVVKVTWRPFEQHRIDSDLLRYKHPKIAKEVEKVTSGRRFFVKSAGLPKEGRNGGA
jgi:putative phage-type endonuclease